MLKADHLCKTLSNKDSTFRLNNISFSLPRGYICGLIGENGSGKSSLIKCLAGLYSLDSGSIYIDSLLFAENEARVKDMLGVVLDTSLYDKNMTLGQTGIFYGGLYKDFNYKQYLDYLEKFNLDMKQKIKHLSKGMKIKVQIAFALSHNAKLFLFDEPSAGLDKEFRKEFLSICTDLISGGDKTILISSHITEDLDRYADYIGYMQCGQLLFLMEKEELCGKFRIIKGENYKCRLLPKEKIVYIEEGMYSSSVMVTGGGKYSSDPSFEVYKPCISEFMYYFVKGGRNNAKNIAEKILVRNM